MDCATVTGANPRVVPKRVRITAIFLVLNGLNIIDFLPQHYYFCVQLIMEHYKSAKTIFSITRR
ncbi:hypothetical protein CY0110_16722 [Crocosphaera chwakensis CCY0110]|uniref:Uncharacterized protein n=1 Tax=Crocosphaera chwakensis CCY0110 TaxID=391612 RepID=A3II26_9CHRO|nr:hypothetical protein CY0110_16722 [Crocosphaera chwakensis CCY0110]